MGVVMDIRTWIPIVKFYEHLLAGQVPRLATPFRLCGSLYVASWEREQKLLPPRTFYCAVKRSARCYESVRPCT